MVAKLGRLGNICFGYKIYVWEAKMFLTWGKNIFFCFRAAKFVSVQHMFHVRLNWETFALATMFPTLIASLHWKITSKFVHEKAVYHESRTCLWTFRVWRWLGKHVNANMTVWNGSTVWRWKGISLCIFFPKSRLSCAQHVFVTLAP